MVQLAVLGRWMASMAQSVGLSRGRDKDEEFILVSCGLMLGRSGRRLFQDASTW